jgi:hypothetical protein
MNIAELKAQHPATYQAALEEGKALGVAEGKKAGFDEGLSTGIVQGSEKERNRIKGIESLRFPGAEAIINDKKYDPSATMESVAVAIVQHESNARQEALKKVGADATAVAEAGAKVGSQGTQEATDDQKVEAMAKAIADKAARK